MFPVTASLKGGAVGNVCKSLLKHGLIEEVAATDHTIVCRHDEERGPMTLRATSLAYSILGVNEDQEWTQQATEAAPQSVRGSSGSKQAALIAMLRAEGGATIVEIADALEWQAHTVRGAMAGALKKKLGLTIHSEKVDGRGRVYILPSD